MTHLGVSMLHPRSVGPIVFSSASNSYGKSRCKKDKKRQVCTVEDCKIPIHYTHSAGNQAFLQATSSSSGTVHLNCVRE